RDGEDPGRIDRLLAAGAAQRAQPPLRRRPARRARLRVFSSEDSLRRADRGCPPPHGGILSPPPRITTDESSERRRSCRTHYLRKSMPSSTRTGGPPTISRSARSISSPTLCSRSL